MVFRDGSFAHFNHITLKRSIVGFSAMHGVSNIYLSSRLGNIVHVHFIRQIHSISIIILHIRDITLSLLLLLVLFLSLSLCLFGATKFAIFRPYFKGACVLSARKRARKRKRGKMITKKKPLQIQTEYWKPNYIRKFFGFCVCDAFDSVRFSLARSICDTETNCLTLK